LLLGREPRSRSELLLVYAAVLAHGTSLSAADISRIVSELSPAAIRQIMNRIADERKLRQAADAVLEFMLRPPIAAHWGRAYLASSDMMSLETTRTVWQARADPRRRTASIGMYTRVASVVDAVHPGVGSHLSPQMSIRADRASSVSARRVPYARLPLDRSFRTDPFSIAAGAKGLGEPMCRQTVGPLIACYGS
jgi:hypothetical protein